MRGDHPDATVQKTMRMGIEVKIAKKMASLVPPPSFQLKYKGTRPRSAKSKALENDSLPAASAGRGAFLIAGYYAVELARVCKREDGPQSML